MKKEHNITTIKEILEVVNEKNLKGFLTDFSNWLSFFLAVRKVKKEMPKWVAIKDETTFKWIDDGKTDAKINIEITTKLQPLPLIK